jgi:hypothetical protein
MILKTTTNDSFHITEEEYKKILQSTTETITLKKGITIRRNCIATIFPENHPDVIQDRKKQEVGVLHDGQKVRKHFGQWVSYREVPDERGNYNPVRLDPEYYPEVAVDCVASPKEFKEIKENKLDYYKHLKIENKTQRIETKGFTGINELLTN